MILKRSFEFLLDQKQKPYLWNFEPNQILKETAIPNKSTDKNIIKEVT